MAFGEASERLRSWLSNRIARPRGEIVQAPEDTPDGLVAPGRNGRLGSPFAPSLKEHPWAIGAAFETSVAFLDGGGDLRMKAPRVGDTARLALKEPFRGLLGEAFWALYEHPHGYRRGYLYGPVEAGHLAALRFVRCRLVPGATLPAPGSYEMIELDADILEVLGPDDLLNLAPSAGDGAASFAGGDDAETNAAGCLRICHWSFLSVNRWVLLATVGARVHLLACGDGVDWWQQVVFGNRPLTEAETAQLTWALEG